jgi:hypothetical protein
MPLSMAIRLVLAATALVVALAGCGGDSATKREVRLLAPPGLADDYATFERQTSCRVDLRVYDDDEDIQAIARRRDVDVVAGPVPSGQAAHDSVELVRIELADGLEVTIPRALASAFDDPVRPAGRRNTRWVIREDGENEDCAERWVDYATSQ